MVTAILLALGLSATAAEIGDTERIGVGVRGGASVLTGPGGGLTMKFFTVPGGGFSLHAGSRGSLVGRVPSYFGRALFERDGFMFADGPNLAGAFYSASGISWLGQDLGDPTFAYHLIGFSQGAGMDFRLRSVPLSIYAEAEFQYYLLQVSGGQVGFVGNGFDIGLGIGTRYYF